MGQLVDVAPIVGFDPSTDECLLVNKSTTGGSEGTVAGSPTAAVLGQAVLLCRKGRDALVDKQTGRFYSFCGIGSRIDSGAVLFSTGNGGIDYGCEIVGVAAAPILAGATGLVRFSGAVRAVIFGSAATTIAKGDPLTLSSATGGFLTKAASGGTQKVVGIYCGDVVEQLPFVGTYTEGSTTLTVASTANYTWESGDTFYVTGGIGTVRGTEVAIASSTTTTIVFSSSIRASADGNTITGYVKKTSGLHTFTSGGSAILGTGRFHLSHILLYGISGVAYNGL